MVLTKLLEELLKVRAFNAAYEVWETIHGLPLGTLPDGRVSDTRIYDGGFEEPTQVVTEPRAVATGLLSVEEVRN